MLIDLERGVARVKHWPWSERFRLAGIEDTHGGNGKDLIIGNDAANTLSAGDGRDGSMERGGNDMLCGHAATGCTGSTAVTATTDLMWRRERHAWRLSGIDFLGGAAGTDELDGGDGTDTCVNGETYVSCELPL